MEVKVNQGHSKHVLSRNTNVHKVLAKKKIDEAMEMSLRQKKKNNAKRAGNPRYPLTIYGLMSANPHFARKSDCWLREVCCTGLTWRGRW
jgi:hypothetical protein